MPDTGEVRGTVEEAWSAALGKGSSGEEDFFTLGGTSLSAVELMTRVESSLGIEFPVELLFSSRALSEIVDECERRHRDLLSRRGPTA
ncbi:acyl carrier protein [Streptomyces sp. NPDC001668]|uniref:acyl carrier protein n=1 Tax=unclassified Streptomyces TaxID=2593676 RepID=UPI0033FDFA5F